MLKTETLKRYGDRLSVICYPLMGRAEVFRSLPTEAFRIERLLLGLSDL